MVHLEAPIADVIAQIQLQLVHLQSIHNAVQAKTYSHVRDHDHAVCSSEHKLDLQRTQRVPPHLPAEKGSIERCNRIRGVTFDPVVSSAQRLDPSKVLITSEIIWQQSMRKCIDASACVVVNYTTKSGRVLRR